MLCNLDLKRNLRLFDDARSFFLKREKRILIKLPRPVFICVCERRFTGDLIPKCFNFPSQEASPLVISFKELAFPSWQNNIDTNCCQQANPFTLYAATRSFTIFSNSMRGKNSNNWLNKSLYFLMCKPPFKCVLICVSNK